uniref:Thioredoxin domain-containing protein n=4 Tax=Lotharella globosa TaxID=91324 RepID=A0A7S4DI45_9EUKA|mmetsp:Transcript_14819/g.27950  ORF Transcript_14819/g.27950 Transcript_14819/m.27950 type:complete len:327 (+) Transcript_14819:18-998(+)|eukprot:CAMPEP_0167779398 /NCGR_PEP_ID=MMETSP0111_2-20121227/4783_1 /TAXON_ID=91324 /ORGANISM="Lotharella globosa, Strain CCCM811" /LENGTH=326 /DNA_ID=CAMNT_0007669801 /DNA_START=22 /DNA_END=1002 /DNA_ORIENTATION=+
MLVVATKKEHDKALAARKPDALTVLYFWADWSDECKQMTSVMQVLAKDHSEVAFLTVEAESVDGVADLYPIEEVPAFILLKGSSTKPVDVIVGANPPKLVEAIKKHSVKKTAATKTESKEDINTRLSKLVNAAPVMLFMKGSPENARCKFSKKIVGLLKEEKVIYSYFDILTDEEVRQGLKTFSNWKTFPQLYIKGKLVGGVDVVAAHIEEGEFRDLLPKGSSKDELEDKLKKLIKKGKVMLFMKGEPSNPRCGFSRKIVDILNSTGVSYETFDILTDQEVRQGLKKFSNWPTYPQLYVDANLVGGLDVVTELQEDGDLLDTLQGQ